MPEPTQTEIDQSLHAFGQRMRAAWDARQADFEKNIAAFREGVREDYAHERDAKGAWPPAITPPEIGKDSKGEPDLGR